MHSGHLGSVAEALVAYQNQEVLERVVSDACTCC